ncbi:MAG: ComEC family competence protein [Candidatus Pacebacteria bacterium]|nr:ComEC family competence protein [Candidatus Paceibacterota bacterium]
MQSVLVIGSVSAFLIGVATRTLYETSFELPIVLLIISLGLAVVWRLKNTPHFLLASLLFLFLSLGIIRTEIASWQFNSSVLEVQLDEKISVTGIVSKEPDYREKTVHLYVETDDDLVLVTTDKFSKFRYGDRVEVTGVLTRPVSFTTDLGRTFNYPGYLRAKEVEYSISFASVKTIESGFGNVLISSLLDAKKSFIKSLRLIVPEPAAGLGVGLLLGVKSALGDDIEQDFRRTGIIHIVVLSGYNVMLVVAFIMFVFSFVFPIKIRIVAGIVAIVAFALVVGLSATVVRASVMASLVLLAQVLGRRYNVMRALILAGALMVLINPYLLIYDIGFQLSFMATLGLILIVPQFESTAMSSSRTLGFREFFLATLATQIAVLPLLMYHIGEVSLIAVLVNMLVLPVVPLAMLLTFITGLLGFIFIPLATLVGYLATLSLSYILVVAEWFGSATYASVSVPQFSVGGVFFMYVLMVSVWYLVKRYSNNSADTLSDWVIEEESESESNKKSVASPTDLPIFFK